MIEVIKVIALLCQVSGGDNTTYNKRVQMACHKWYLECYERHTEIIPDLRLGVCITERK